MFYTWKSQFREEEEKKRSSNWGISVFFTNLGYDMTTPYYSFSLHYLSSGRLREVKNKGKFKTFSSKSGRGRLQEVPNIVSWTRTRGGHKMA